MPENPKPQTVVMQPGNTLQLNAESFKGLEVGMKGDIAAVEREIAKGRILESALSNLKNQPGFNPAALSINFGLKW